MKDSRHTGDFSHSLTDLMSGVAVLFLVIAAIFMVQASQASRKAQLLAAESRRLAERNQLAAKKYEEIDQRDQQGIQEIEGLMASLSDNRRVELIYDKKKDPRLLTIIFDRETFSFDTGECEVGNGDRQVLRETLQEIFPKICKTVGGGLQKSITLEGHTDNQTPLGGIACDGVEAATACRHSGSEELCQKQKLEGNVKLSAARAQYVFFEAREALKTDPIVAECLDRNFLVAGRGPMDPLDGRPWDAPRPDEENRRNRRVVIKVRVSVATDNGVTR